MYNTDSVYYASKINVLGTIGKLDFLKDVITLVDDKKELHEVSLKDVQELKQVGVLYNGIHVYEHDVLHSTTTDKNYEIILLDNLTACLEQLDDDFNSTGRRGKSFGKESITSLQEANLVGNVFQLRKAVPKVDFNIEIYKDIVDGDYVYYYAGNNKDNKTVDLIKVIYMGSALLQEEEYERTTYTYKEFLELVKDGLIKKANPMELQNYVMGKTYNGDSSRDRSPYNRAKCACGRDYDDCLGCDEMEEMNDFDFDVDKDNDSLWSF